MKRVIYLHGFASAPSSSKAQYFRRILEDAGAAVSVPDLADGDFEHLTISAQLRLIEECAAGEPVSLIGSSLGGYLAALYAARRKEVARVALLAPAFGFARIWSEYLGHERLGEWQRKGSIEVFHYGVGANRRLGFGLMEDARQYEPFPSFRQPALIFHGRRDDVVPVRGSEEFTAMHPDARLEVVESGHDLLNVLEEIGPEVVEFLLGRPPKVREMS